MKKLFLFLLISFSVNSQNYQREWGQYIFNERYTINDSKVDSAGNVYLVGTVNTTDITALYTFINFINPYHDQPLGGDTDGFILKMNNAGALIWATFIGGLGNDAVASITIEVCFVTEVKTLVWPCLI